MKEDEKAIRELMNEWQDAAMNGDVIRLQRLLSDDVVFLTPGQPPVCGRDVFLDAFREGLQHYRIESRGEIKDICITADLAYCWTYLSVTAIPHQRGLPVRRSGNTLSVLKKQPDSGWVIVRDANMLTPQPVTVPVDSEGGL